MLTLLAGLAAGIVHVLAGPDHLAAVAPLAADRPVRGWVSGMWWGVGHTVGVLAVGVLALLLRNLIPVEAVSSWGERLVGVALVAIGFWGLRRAFLNRWHAHQHHHDGVPHVHLHYHPPAGDHARGAAYTDGAAHNDGAAHAHGHFSVAMGALHGVAGSAHILGILPAMAFPALADGAAYLAAFGLGAVLAMTAYGWLVGRLVMRAGTGAFRWVLTGASTCAVAVGLVWLAA